MLIAKVIKLFKHGAISTVLSMAFGLLRVEKTSFIMAISYDFQIADTKIDKENQCTKYIVHKIMKDQIFETAPLYRVEYELIRTVQTFRIERGWSQRVLSEKMGFAEAFVGNCESLDQQQKYNLRHIGILMRVFGFESVDDLFPNGFPGDEQIIIRYKKVPKKKADGTLSKLMENKIVEIVCVDAETKNE